MIIIIIVLKFAQFYTNNATKIDFDFKNFDIIYNKNHNKIITK